MMPVDGREARLSVGLVSPGWPARRDGQWDCVVCRDDRGALEEVGVGCEVLTPQLLEQTGEDGRGSIELRRPIDHSLGS